MANAVDRYDVARRLIENRIGKSPRQSTTVVFMNFCVHFGHATDRLNARIEAGEELFAQPGPLSLVPAVRFVNVLGGFWTQ
jgi:hypothetical protein